MCALVLELMLAFQKNHFYGILVNLGVQAIVLMGFFDKYYMRCLLVNLLLAAILDFVWLFAHADVRRT